MLPVDAHLHVHRNDTVVSLLNIAVTSESEQKQQLLRPPQKNTLPVKEKAVSPVAAAFALTGSGAQR